MIVQNRSWSEAAAELQRAGKPFAVATLIATSGSTPRASGTKMVVSSEHTYATIGGGQLEFLVVQRARELLIKGTDCQEIKQFPLGAEARQCCGGSVTVMLECFAGDRLPVVVFGAGHVSQALMNIFQALPFNVTWIDSRSELFTEQDSYSNIRQLVVPEPESIVEDLPDNAYVLVLTHDHALDFRLAQRLLENWRWQFFGLIGSAHKAKRFRARLKNEGVDNALIERMQCPVGMPEVKGKLPMQVAVSIAAEIISLSDQSESCSSDKALNWKQMKRLLRQETGKPNPGVLLENGNGTDR